MRRRELFQFLMRYLAILLIGLAYYPVLLLLAPITLYLSYFLLVIFYPSAYIEGSSIFFNSHEIQLIAPCISVLAYMLLSALSFSVPMASLKRAKSLAFSLAVFLIFNVLRIVLLAVAFDYSIKAFSALHLFFWYFANIAAVVIIWFITIRLFRIKEVPLASDIRILISYVKKK